MAEWLTPNDLEFQYKTEDLGHEETLNDLERKYWRSMLANELPNLPLDDLRLDALIRDTGTETRRALSEFFASRSDLTRAITGDPLAVTDVAMSGLIANSSSSTRDEAARAGGRIVVKGGGTSDDTALIQSYLNSVSPSLGVMTVYIPAGTYMINGVNEANTGKNRYVDAGLKPKSGTTLILDPKAILKVISNNSPGYAAITLGNEQDGVTITGGTIEGDRATHDYTGHGGGTHEWGFGISILGVRNATIDGVKIRGCTGDAIHVGPRGIKTQSTYRQSEHIVVRNCTLDMSRRNNLSVIGGDFVLIENNLITNAGVDDGIQAGVAPRYGIDLEQYGEGSVDYEDVERVVVRGNKFFNNIAASVFNFNGYGVVIEGNFADTTIGYGYGTETIIKSNVVVNLTNTTRPGITGNSMALTYRVNAKISGNIVLGFAESILIANDTVTVEDNYVSGFWTSGISVYKAQNANVSDNRIEGGKGPSAVGISVVQGTDISLISNTIDNVRTSIKVSLESLRVNVRKNGITKCYQGIRVETGCEAVLSGNEIYAAGHPSGEISAIFWDPTAVVLCIWNIIRRPASYAIQGGNTTGGKAKIVENTIFDALGISAVYLTGGTFEVVRNIISIAKTTNLFYPISLTNVTKAIVIGNSIYPSPGGVKADRLVSCSSSSDTRVVGNVAVGPTEAVTGDTGTPVIAGNTLVPMWT